MILSVTFSAWLYTEATREVRTGLNAQLLRPYSNMLPRDEVNKYLDDQYNASKFRILGSLALLNVGVLAAGSFISYFLARRTLHPIEEALMAQNRFTADASHELRTPLTTMKTEIEVALRDKDLSVSDARDLLKSNVEEIDRLSKLSNDLLVLARLGEKADLAKTAVGDIAKKTSHRFASAAQAKHIVMAQSIQPAMAMANESHVSTIMGILMDNAIKYSPKKATVTVAVEARDGKISLTVHNTGAYIPAKDVPHIFDRFYRVDAARASGPTAGHGLGLSIAQKLAASMNGTLAVMSQEQAGTTFTLWLQAAAK